MSEVINGFQCSNLALAFYAGTFPVVVAVPAAVLYLESPTRDVIWRLFSLSSLIILWCAITFAAIDLWQLDSAAGYTLLGIIASIGVLLTVLILVLAQAIGEHMQYKRYKQAREQMASKLEDSPPSGQVRA